MMYEIWNVLGMFENMKEIGRILMRMSLQSGMLVRITKRLTAKRKLLFPNRFPIHHIHYLQLRLHVIEPAILICSKSKEFSQHSKFISHYFPTKRRKSETLITNFSHAWRGQRVDVASAGN